MVGVSCPQAPEDDEIVSYLCCAWLDDDPSLTCVCPSVGIYLLVYILKFLQSTFYKTVSIEQKFINLNLHYQV